MDIDFSLKLIGGAVLIGAWAFRHWRLGQVSQEKISDFVCVACGSADPEVVGPGMYRCAACGYEGGSGWAVHLDAERRKGFDAMDPTARIASARDDLEYAQRLLKGSMGTLDGAKQAATLDLMGGGSLSGAAGAEIDEAQNRLTTVLGDYELAKRSVLDAVHKLRLSETVASDRSDPARVVLWSMEDQGVAEIFFDIAMLKNIDKTRHACEVLLREVENTLERFPEDKPEDA